MKDFFEIHLFEKFTRDILKEFKPETEKRFNRSEVELLTVLAKEKGKPFRHYGKRVKLEKGSFTYLVDLLVEKGLVLKIIDQFDRRKKTLDLTEKGNKMVEDVNRQFVEYIEKKFEVFNEEDLKSLDLAFNIIERLDKKYMENEKKPRQIDDKPYE